MSTSKRGVHTGSSRFRIMVAAGVTVLAAAADSVSGKVSAGPAEAELLGVTVLAAAAGVTVLAAAGVVTTSASQGADTGAQKLPQHVRTVDSPSINGAAVRENPVRVRLVQPEHVSVDAGLSPQRARLVLRRVRELYTFWDTGDVRLLHRAASPEFVDHTLPAGRPQGLAGIEQAMRTFRAAVPDLRCTVADVLVSGNRVSVRQVYTGHFTGTYDGVRGRGQTVRFNAFDIQQVGRDQIVADWHLEDNLTFLQQIGVR